MGSPEILPIQPAAVIRPYRRPRLLNPVDECVKGSKLLLCSWLEASVDFAAGGKEYFLLPLQEDIEK
jgi:hypothetical protein